MATYRCMKTCYADRLYEAGQEYEIDPKAPHAEYFDVPKEAPKDEAPKGKPKAPKPEAPKPEAPKPEATAEGGFLS